MILEYLLENVTPESLMNEIKGLEIDVPEQEDYEKSLWPEIKSKKFISTYEKIKGSEGLWQLSFNESRLYLIQFNIEFGSKSENAYNKCMDICKSIIKINNGVREMYDQLTGSYRKTYLEFKSEAMSDHGIPHGHYLQFANYTWKNSARSSSLTAGCTWPDTMSVEYREEPV